MAFQLDANQQREGSNTEPTEHETEHVEHLLNRGQVVVRHGPHKLPRQNVDLRKSNGAPVHRGREDPGRDELQPNQTRPHRQRQHHQPPLHRLQLAVQFETQQREEGWETREPQKDQRSVDTVQERPVAQDMSSGFGLDLLLYFGAAVSVLGSGLDGREPRGVRSFGW